MSAPDQVQIHKIVSPKKAAANLERMNDWGFLGGPDQIGRNYHVGAKWPTPFSADQIWLSPCIEKKKLRGAQHEAWPSLERQGGEEGGSDLIILGGFESKVWQFNLKMHLWRIL